MKHTYAGALALMLLAGPVAAADSEARTSPQDDNPACLERNGPDCVIADDAQGRLRAIVVVPANPSTPSPPGPAQLPQPQLDRTMGAPPSTRQFGGPGGLGSQSGAGTNSGGGLLRR
jgi:hypothetical protein